MCCRSRFTAIAAQSVLTGIWLTLALGCRMSAPIHVWTPPKIHSTVAKRVAIDTIAGDPVMAKKIHEKMLASAPSDAGRSVFLVDANQLQSKSAIQLASFSGEGANDVALASVARSEGYDYILRGEILENRHRSPHAPERLTVSWRLMSLDPAQLGLAAKHLGGQPVVVKLDEALEKYPDLAFMEDEATMLATAAARSSYELLTPSIDRDSVQLAIPYLKPGSAQVRRANMLARAGRWGEAQAIWQQVYDEHPSQIAALHNLAVAAVAAQDFSQAKDLIRQVIQRRSSKLHEETLVWIELNQRRYHQSFALPDPPEGWFVTKNPTSRAAASN